MLIAYSRFHFYKSFLFTLRSWLQVKGFALIGWACDLWWPISVMTLEATVFFRRSGLSLTQWDPYWFLDCVDCISMIHSLLQHSPMILYPWSILYSFIVTTNHPGVGETELWWVCQRLSCWASFARGWTTLPTCGVFWPFHHPVKVSSQPCLRWSKASWSTWTHQQQSNPGWFWGWCQMWRCLSSTCLLQPSTRAKTAKMDVGLSKQSICVYLSSVQNDKKWMLWYYSISRV